MTPNIEEQDLIRAAAEGTEAFLNLVCDTILQAVGGELSANTMADLNGEQITLLAYRMLRDEVMEGGFVQLIHNGLGPFIFLNPFAKAMRLWGEETEKEAGTTILHDFSKLIYKGRKFFEQYGDELTRPCTDDEFMALFEQYPAFDDLDDVFVEAEEEITATIAHYVDEHIGLFVAVKK